MIKYAPIFDHEGNKLLSSHFFGSTKESAVLFNGVTPSKETPDSFAERIGMVHTGEIFEFVDGAKIMNRALAVFPPGQAQYITMLCIEGPILEGAAAEIWIGDEHRALMKPEGALLL